MVSARRKPRWTLTSVVKDPKSRLRQTPRGRRWTVTYVLLFRLDEFHVREDCEVKSMRSSPTPELSRRPKTSTSIQEHLVLQPWSGRDDGVCSMSLYFKNWFPGIAAPVIATKPGAPWRSVRFDRFLLLRLMLLYAWPTWHLAQG